MGPRLATIVVESRLLVREALKSLMAKHSYRVVYDVASTAEICGATIAEEPKLVILGARSAENALSEAVSARTLWPDSKIILLVEHAAAADFQMLLTSQIDGCVPLFVSPDSLICALDMILIGDIRVMVVADSDRPMIQPAQPEKSHQSEIKVEKLQPEGAEHENVSVGIGAMQHAQPPLTLRNHPGLSEREVQILDSLVKGHANKLIARACDVSEATVKVHVKSILRKIGVGNRTQAAIWATEHDYGAEFEGRLLKPASPAPARAGAVEPVGGRHTAKTLNVYQRS
jgi:two-component system nitrate/nitrite response regulator NarL